MLWKSSHSLAFSDITKKESPQAQICLLLHLCNLKCCQQRQNVGLHWEEGLTLIDYIGNWRKPWVDVSAGPQSKAHWKSPLAAMGIGRGPHWGNRNRIKLSLPWLYWLSMLAQRPCGKISGLSLTDGRVLQKHIIFNVGISFVLKLCCCY